ncbi:hypothetical protein ZIOFF_065784 [Zingiber officinale]|uniref:Alpha-1,3-glucosyltransferase n=1 Tax=Zingiber officinale TaxID=94328 RepID=A0A8J5EXQ3_ZINOF|nr:hypothetical protein ZIOFF_065784 [Zingiber officinale]
MDTSIYIAQDQLFVPHMANVPADHIVHRYFLTTSNIFLLLPWYAVADIQVQKAQLEIGEMLPLSKFSFGGHATWNQAYPQLLCYIIYLLSILRCGVDVGGGSVRQGSPDPVVPQHRLRSASPLARPHLQRSPPALVLRYIGSLLLPIARRSIVLVLLLWSPALLIVDHIHFQYNGYLLGILLLSLSFLEEGRDLAAGIAFSVLICSKHLFLIAAPLYFVYLLRHYCRGSLWKASGRFLIMGGVVGAVFVAAFGPFFYYGQIQQVLSRLFPFGRGLCHAYWAPNFWVFYIVIDKLLAVVLSKLGFDIPSPEASFTGGLVGNSSHFAVLPQVTPLITFVTVLLSMSPCLIKAFQKPQAKHLIRWVAYAFTCGFMFGWHVHEKASLHFTIPLAVISVDSLNDARHYFLLSIVSCYSMFPLLFEPQEYPIKVLLLTLYAIAMWIGFSSYFKLVVVPAEDKAHTPSASDREETFIGKFGTIYLLGLLGVELWGQLLHPYIFGSSLPFLPLMMISIYCAIGMVCSWAWQLRQILQRT